MGSFRQNAPPGTKVLTRIDPGPTFRDVGDCRAPDTRRSPPGQVLSGAATETPPPPPAPAPVNVCVLLLSRRIIINAARSLRLALSEVEPWLSSSLVRWPELENASAQVEWRTRTPPGRRCSSFCGIFHIFSEQKAEVGRRCRGGWGRRRWRRP